MTVGSHFGCPKITSYHFISIPQFILLWIFFTKWLPVAILDVRNSLSMAFLAFQIDRPFCMSEILVISDRYGFFLEIFDKMAGGGHFGCSKITFDVISGFTFDSNSGHFRSIQNFFFNSHFGCPKITFDWIYGHFRSIGHFGCPKFTFYGISGHFRFIRNLIYI